MIVRCMKKTFDPVTGKMIPVFFYYSVPSVLSMLALSCAFIIDGIFIGNYSGSDSLAAVNLTVPVSAVMIGIAMMISVGGAARCGRYLGKRNFDAAGAVFSQTVVVMLTISLTASACALVFTKHLVGFLGANDAIRLQTAEYLKIIMFFNVFQLGIVCHACFLRVAGYPLFAAGIVIGGSALNVLLDWVLVAKLGMGHKGAALGTGISEMVTFLILSVPFVMKNTSLKFNWKASDMPEVFKAACNGFSEFSNEVSSGLITFVFNWIIMERLGVSGVAAFTVINYIILCGIMINCGIGEAIQPVVSKNYGALKAGRIVNILCISTATAFVIGLIICALLILIPGILTDLFVKSGNRETAALTITFISNVWPAFLLNGINIVSSSYLTAMNRAFHSTVVSLARNLFLPVLFLLTLPLLTGHKGIFIVLPLSELVTFFIAIYLLNRNSPAKLIQRYC